MFTPWTFPPFPKLGTITTWSFLFSEIGQLPDFHATLLKLVRNKTGDIDPTARQLCLLLGVVKTQQTVRGMAADLNISKPAISRAADRMAEIGYLVREEDKTDRRSVLLTITKQGKAFLKEIMAE
jgi:DNA-binding MarR family transcriptional regulator